MGGGLKSRFESYGDKIAGALMHADRDQPCRWYLKGLMLPGKRKCVEPMAARVQPDNVRSAHQSMQHLVADSPWSDRAALAVVAEQLLPELLGDEGPVWWIEAALSAGHRRGVVLADAAYGGDTAWREQLAGHGLSYAVAVRSSTTVWWGDHQPVPEPVSTGQRGRPRCRVQRDEHHQPISVFDLAHDLPRRAWREVSWREGVAGALSSRFARVRVRAAQKDRPPDKEWLIIEWPENAQEPAHYWFSYLSKGIAMIDTVMGRWRIERDFQELKQELGLGQYEGRNWRGFHHHATLCIAAYGFLLLERLSGSKKNAARFETPALPEGFRPRSVGPNATS